MKYKPINLNFYTDLDSFIDKIIFDINVLSDKKDYFENSNSINCWIWNAFRDRDGYGVFRKFRAHRVSYYFKHKHIDDCLLIGHVCNNPNCVNPNHLIQITNQENMNYMVESGRSASGEKHARSNLNEIIIQEILLNIFNNVPKSYILSHYKISESQLFHILNGDSWEKVTDLFCKTYNTDLITLKNKIFGTYQTNVNNQYKKSDNDIYDMLKEIFETEIIQKKDIMKKYNISRSTINQILNGYSRTDISKKFEKDFNIRLQILKDKLYGSS